MQSATLNLDAEDGSHPEGGSLKGKRVFIIEDDVFLGSMLSQRISSEANEVKLFKNGEDAITEMGKNIPRPPYPKPRFGFLGDKNRNGKF